MAVVRQEKPIIWGEKSAIFLTNASLPMQLAYWSSTKTSRPLFFNTAANEASPSGGSGVTERKYVLERAKSDKGLINITFIIVSVSFKIFKHIPGNNTF